MNFIGQYYTKKLLNDKYAWLLYKLEFKVIENVYKLIFCKQRNTFLKILNTSYVSRYMYR